MSPKDKDDRDKVEEPTTINKWDLTAVKNALDDAVRDVLITKLNYAENFNLVDGRLLISCIAVVIALIALLWDFWYPFPECKSVLLVCVTAYFVMMGILTIYAAYIEKGIFTVAVQPDNEHTWKACSYMKRFDDIYSLTLSCTKPGEKEEQTATFDKSVANFFDTEGTLLYDLLEPEVLKLHSNIASGKKFK